MSIDELRVVYANSDITEDPVFNQGIDGESNDLVVKKNGKT
jgi:hypothetical protein